MKRNSIYGIVISFALSATSHGAVLMVDYPLGGGQHASTLWTNLSNSNPGLGPDAGHAGGGAVSVTAPGYQAGIGFYSYTGHYLFAAVQTAAFDIGNVGFQFEASVNDSFDWPFDGGPTLTLDLTSGLETVLPVASAAGSSETRATFGELEYTAYAWQWDLSSYAEEITAVTVNAPISAHSSVMAARIDVGDGFSAVGLVPEPSSSVLCLATITLLALRRKRGNAIHR